MAGRRRLRAASNSTVATVDEQSIVYTKENQIIRPPATGTKSDYWPCFLLTEAVVYNKHGQMANLLHVDLEGPFMIRGLMVVEPDQSSCLIRGYQRTRSTWIEVSRTFTYSIGLKEDSGTPVVWALGECAHFEIIPAGPYMSIANIMFQGVNMHYNILDLYEAELELMNDREQTKPKQKRRKIRLQDVKLPLQDILYRYAAAVGDGATVEEVTQRCKDQAGFLLGQFPRETGFHAWLSSECPDIVQRLKKKPSPSASLVFTEPEPSASKPATVRQKSSSAESRGSRGKAKAALRTSGSGSSADGSRGPADQFESASDDQRGSRSRSARVKQNSSQRPKKHEASELVDIDMKDFASKPVTLPARAKNETTATASSSPNSALFALIGVLNEERQKVLDLWKTGAKQKKHPDSIAHTGWQTKMYLAMSITNYSAKSEVLQYHAGGLAEHLGPEWHKSALYQWAKQNANIKPVYNHITEDHILRIQRRQKGVNAKPQPDKTTQTPVETSGKQPPSGRPSGKAAGLRPSLGSKKRPRSPDDDEDEMEVDEEVLPRKKTAKTSQFFANDKSEVEQADTTTSSDDEHEDSTTKETLTRIVIHAEPLPSTRPKGPNHTWTCEELDCDYVVRSAHDAEGQELIHQHFEEHEKEASDEAKERELSKVNLAMQESRGHLPIKYAYFPPFLIEVHYHPTPIHQSPNDVS
ncbi:defective in methylation-7 protein-like protein [Seiridium cupressi]